MIQILQILILGIGLWSLAASAHAVGIAVSPPALRLSGSLNKKITGSFTVTNPSRETVVYEVSNDGLLSLTMTPTTFLLEPGKEAKVRVEYLPTRKLTAGELSTTQLSILGRPLTVNPTQAASGVKLPVTISVAQVAGAAAQRTDPLTTAIFIVDALLLGCLAFALLRRYFRTRRISALG